MPDARFSEDFWTDPKIKALDMDTQRLFIYLFTNPHRNYCGLYYLPKSFIREQTGLSDRAIDRGIDTLQKGLFIEYSEEYQVVFVINMLKRKAPGFINDKQIKGITNHLNRLHGCYLIKSFLEHYKSLKITVSYTPIHTPMDVQSQSTSKSQSIYTPPNEPGGDNGLKPKKPKPIPLPKNFTLSPEVIAWAKDKGHTHLEAHLEAFTEYARSNGKTYVDWDCAFKRCVRENWGKIDYSKPDISYKPSRKVCPTCGAWEDKCKCKSGKPTDSPRQT
jgi:hypothetical protein